MTEAYPLQWPVARQRTAENNRERARFSHKGWSSSYLKPITFQVATKHLYEELERLGAENIVLSSNLKLKQDGYPYANQGRIDDPGIAVYFILDGRELCFSCDKWNRGEDNIRAIAKSIEAIRGLNRWGSKDMVEAAFRGFHALPAPEDAIAMSGYPQFFEDCVTAEDIKETFRRLAKDLHPDKGGDPDEYNELQRQKAIAESRIK